MDIQSEQDLILDFLSAFPEQLSSRKRGANRPNPTSSSGREEIRKIISAAQNTRLLPKSPETIPDEAVSIILREYWELPEEDLERAKEQHQLSMSSENIVGEVLEDYISTTCRHINSKWVRAYGDVIKSVDFIKKEEGRWELLQIKNRDNSENSSSQSVRKGTEIIKWFRSFSKKGGTNWEAFPDQLLKNYLNEEGFINHLIEYLSNHR